MKYNTSKTPKEDNPYYLEEYWGLSHETGYNKKITDEQVIGFTYVACLNFSIRLLIVKIRKSKHDGVCKWNRKSTPLNVIFNITYNRKSRGEYECGIVAHEVAHALQFVRTGNTQDDSNMLPFTQEVQEFLDVYMTKHLYIRPPLF